ncbi:MAG: hypothetical protein AB4062_05675 [Crocosphaera sp.]
MNNQKLPAFQFLSSKKLLFLAEYPENKTIQPMPLRLTLTILGIFGTITPTMAASFSGQLSNITLQADLDQLVLFELENVEGENSPVPEILTTGTGTAQGTSTNSTLWTVDDTFTVLELDYDGGTISGESGSEGSASAFVSGNSNKLAITDLSGGGQLFTIEGTYSLSLTTVIENPEVESAEAEFTLRLVTESGNVLESFSQLISGNDSFSETQNFTTSFMVGANETVFLESELSGSAQQEMAEEIPESSSILGCSILLGMGALMIGKKELRLLTK